MSPLFPLFLITSLANILTPGLGVVMILTLAARYGWRRTLGGCAGTALGIAFLFAVALSGVGLIVAASPMLFAALKLAGACFMLWLGIHTWRRPVPSVSEGGGNAGVAMEESLFWKCFLLSVSNPQPMIFSVSIFPQFIDPQLSYVRQAVVMTAAYAFMVFAAMVVYAVLADRVRTFIAKGRGPQLINRASGAIFVLMALFVGINAVSAFV
ncbi:MAG: LysE family translocator [Sutterella sp.]|nr:LysE family translocator [Sutterella sp.]